MKRKSKKMDVTSLFNYYHEYDDRGNKTYFEMSDGKSWKYKYDNKNNRIYSESNIYGVIKKTKYNTKGDEVSNETITKDYSFKHVLNGGEWQTAYHKRKDGTNIIYDTNGELTHFEDEIGNYRDKQEMAGVPICPFSETDRFNREHGVSVIELFDENGEIDYCDYRFID